MCGKYTELLFLPDAGAQRGDPAQNSTGQEVDRRNKMKDSTHFQNKKNPVSLRLITFYRVTPTAITAVNLIYIPLSKEIMSCPEKQIN